MVRMAKSARYGPISAIIVAIIWGLSFVAARMALQTITPILLATVRFIIASLIFIPILIREYRRGNTLKSWDLIELMLLGFLGISLYFWLQYTGVKYVGAGISALLVIGFIPIFTGFVSTFILKEDFNIQQMSGVVLGLFGIVLITIPGLLLDEVDLLFYIGIICLLLNAACWALYSTLSRRLMHRIKNPSLVTAYVTILGTIILASMSITSDWSMINSLQPEQWLSIFYLSLVCSCVGYFLWSFALSRMEAVKAAIWLYLEPIAAFIGEAVIFSIIPSPLTMIGGGIIITGALITTWARN